MRLQAVISRFGFLDPQPGPARPVRSSPGAGAGGDALVTAAPATMPVTSWEFAVRNVGAGLQTRPRPSRPAARGPATVGLKV